MNIRAVLTVNAVLATAHGIGFILAPSLLLSIYQIASTPGTALMGQLFGVELLFIAVVCWKARAFTSPDVLLALAQAGVVANLAGTILCAIAVLGGVTGAMGWLAVLIYALLALGFLLVIAQKGYRSSAA